MDLSGPTLFAAGSFVCALVSVWVAVVQYRRNHEDVSIKIVWKDGLAPSWDQTAESAAPISLELAATNLGGSRSPRGKVTVTLVPGYAALPSPGWKEGAANSLMGVDVEAVETTLGRLRTHEKVELPPLAVRPKRPNVEGGAKHFGGRIRWEVWLRGKGAGADDLSFKLRVSRPG